MTDLAIPVCTFRRVFETAPMSEVLTLPELTAALRRFELKAATLTKIERDVARIAQGAKKLRSGEAPRGKFMGKMARAAEQARGEGRDPIAALEREAQLLIDDARRGAKRDLRLWSPALYRPGADKRGSENVTHVSCLVCDYDDGTPIAEASDTWSAWFHLVHTTWSHSEEHPKFRLVLPLAFPVPAEDWSAVWAWAEEHARFSIDPSMKSPAATYALPAVPSRDSPRVAFSRPGAILDPVAERIVERRSALVLEPRRPPAGVPSVIRGEDPEKEYIDHVDPDAVYFVDEEWDGADWDEPIVAASTVASPRRAEPVAPVREPAAAVAPTDRSIRATDEALESDAVTPAADRSVRRSDEALESDAVTPAADRSVRPSDEALESDAVTPAADRSVHPTDEALEGEANARADRAPKDPRDAITALASTPLDAKRLRDAVAVLTEAADTLRALLGDAGASPDAIVGDVRSVGPGRHRRTLAVDFDGVLHSYRSGWQGPHVVADPPVDGAIRWLTEAVERFDVAITSVRCAQSGGIDAMRAWFAAHGLPSHVLERLRFPVGKPPAEIYIDDRAYRFEGEFPSFDELGTLVPWTRPRRG